MKLILNHSNYTITTAAKSMVEIGKKIRKGHIDCSGDNVINWALVWSVVEVKA